jgi:hypothetical protein
MFEQLFEGVKKAPDTVEFEISASYCEIYMEKINDLLNRMYYFCVHYINFIIFFKLKADSDELIIRESKQSGIYVDGLIKKPINNANDFLEMLNEGNENKVIASTGFFLFQVLFLLTVGMNERSSRSHTIFMVFVKQTNKETKSTKLGDIIFFLFFNVCYVMNFI